MCKGGSGWGFVLISPPPACLLIFPSELKTPSSLKLIINLSLSTSSFPGEHKGRRRHETGMASPEPLPSELPSQDTRTQNLGPVWRAGSALEANEALAVPGVSSAHLYLLWAKGPENLSCSPPTQG